MKDPNIPPITPGKPVETVKVTTPNGVEIDAVIVKKLSFKTWICYAQNRLFTVDVYIHLIDGKSKWKIKYGEIICDYCIIPNLDVE